MHDQVGITADRGCEMGITPERETEMPVILGRVFRLRLAAQHHLVDEDLGIVALHARKHVVE